MDLTLWLYEDSAEQQHQPTDGHYRCRYQLNVRFHNTFLLEVKHCPREPEPTRALTCRLRTRVLRIPLQTADVPVVRLHGLLTTRIVALSQEVHLVLRNLHEVFATSIYQCRDALESLTSPYRVRAARLHEIRLVAQVNAVARIARGGSPAVRRKQHSTMFVRLFLTALAQCAGYIVNTGLPCYFCHNVKVWFNGLVNTFVCW